LAVSAAETEVLNASMREKIAAGRSKSRQTVISWRSGNAFIHLSVYAAVRARKNRGPLRDPRFCLSNLSEFATVESL
jgi:hypothetical protein